MIKVAVVKPDHLGDLVLASPAIRAAQSKFGNVSLFVSDSSRALAKFLFPDIELRSINFPHLARKASSPFDAKLLISELNGFDLVLWLRDDPPIRALAAEVSSTQDFSSGGHLTHETAIEQRMMVRHVGNYSRTDLYSSAPIQWPMSPNAIGLCVAAGFPTNRWPNAYWIELAMALARNGATLTLIGGPGEKADIALISRLMPGVRIQTLIGGHDFDAFFDALNAVDLVIATDGGTAHICSLRKPVLSIFGSSPWRRYSPFGRNNIVITRDLPCSPCLQFSTEEVNGCVTRECLTALVPAKIVDFLNNPKQAAGDGFVVQQGTSHVFTA